MSRLSGRARRLISRRLDEYVDEADSAIVANEVAVAGENADETLHHTAEAAASAYHAADCTRSPPGEDDGLIHERMDDAHFAALDALSGYIEQLVAEAYADVVRHADEWAARGEDPDVDVLNSRTREEYDEAKREAREWLQLHLDAARRADTEHIISGDSTNE
jgi:hypothetical protein